MRHSHNGLKPWWPPKNDKKKTDRDQQKQQQKQIKLLLPESEANTINKLDPN